MSKFWGKVKAFVARLDTKDARRSVADDLKKASSTLFGLLLVSVPGSFAVFLHAVAAALGVTAESLKVSTATLVLLLLGSVGLRVAAFVLECDVKDAEKKDVPKKDVEEKKTGKPRK